MVLSSIASCYTFKMIQAAIFDMDGLLIDSEPFWRQSHIEVNAAHGFKITEEDVRAMAGHRTDEVVRHWITLHDWQGADEKQLALETIGKVIEHVKESGLALPGVEEIFELLREHQIPIAVASSSVPELIEVVMERLGVANKVMLTHSAIHEEFGKPHPAVFLTTAKKLGVEAENCLVLEDALSGIRAAKAAGMKCIAVPEGANRSKHDFQIADVIVNSLEDISWEDIAALWSSNAG
jgi:mannitol-1-/sugar-/sorbitol-6-/2-deoxyglucose-6-phosphatase